VKNLTPDLTPEQYVAGVEKLILALDLHGDQDEDVFTLAAKAIERGHRAKFEAQHLMDTLALFADIDSWQRNSSGDWYMDTYEGQTAPWTIASNAIGNISKTPP
jgi:hypothetical protein